MYTHTLWDKVSRINGVEASALVARREDIAAADTVVLVLDESGHAVMIQPTDPEQPGHAPMDEARALEVGAALAEELNNPPEPVADAESKLAAIQDALDADATTDDLRAILTAETHDDLTAAVASRATAVKTRK